MSSSNLAILFADISGSTRLYELLGDTLARSKIMRCFELLTEIVEGHGGTVVKTIGDEIMCTFPAADAAVNGASAMQETLDAEVAEQTANGPIKLAIRVGLHFGPAIVETGDVFGDAVNVAARMAKMAKPGQIITTEATVTALPRMLRANTTRLVDHAPVKGKRDSMDIYEIIWQQEDITRMLPTVIADTQDSLVRLRLDYNDINVMLDHERSQVVIGRSKGADIAVEEVLASRLHAKIEHRRGKFYLTDQSTNGTYVKIGDKEAFVRRDEVVLTGDGAISLGRPFNENPTELVLFHLEA
jgi:adenylate cyclase